MSAFVIAATDPVSVGVFAALAVALVVAYLIVAWAWRNAPKISRPKCCPDVAASRLGALSCIHEPGHGGAHVCPDGTRWVLTGGEAQAWKAARP